MVSTALQLVDEAIAELEARLSVVQSAPSPVGGAATTKPKKAKAPPPSSADDGLPAICKLEFKIGQIVKVWEHENADKLYCEEIDVGESEPRQIASGLRPYYTLEQMQGQRLLVISNLKPKSMLGFKSYGMVLCATKEGQVEFVEPPLAAPLGEVITFADLPPPAPMSAAQVEKRKLWQKVSEYLQSNDERIACYQGHAFMTSAGPCTTNTLKNATLQ